MEKRTPQYRLSVVKALVAQGQIRYTRSAMMGAAGLGLDLDSIRAVIQALKPTDFHKSMTTHSNHRIWQDVYRPNTMAGPIYLKITALDGVLVISFKEL